MTAQPIWFSPRDGFTARCIAYFGADFNHPIEDVIGLDRWIEREEGEGDRVGSTSPRWVECRSCGRQDEACNQRACRACRACGSTTITRHGGQPQRRRRYDE